MVARVAVVAVLLSACGGAGDDAASALADAATSHTDAPKNGGPTQTLVTGSLYGSPVTLRYGAHEYNWPNGLNWVCAADIPVTYAECQQTGSPSRLMFLGAYVPDDGNGQPKWSIIQVWLYRVGPGSTSDVAENGTLQIFQDDATVLKMTFDVDFGDTQHTTGSIVVP